MSRGGSLSTKGEKKKGGGRLIFMPLFTGKKGRKKETGKLGGRARSKREEDLFLVKRGRRIFSVLKKGEN